MFGRRTNNVVISVGENIKGAIYETLLFHFGHVRVRCFTVVARVFGSGLGTTGLV